MKFKREEWFTIPNLLGYFRLIMIPVFVYLYLHAETLMEYYYAAAAIGISGLTDLFDGKIARKLNQVTELGKFLDPLADKLTQGAVFVCVTMKYKWMCLLVGLFFIKEGFMGIMGLLMLRHNGRKLDGAMWFGKVCTAAIYVVLFVVLLFPQMSEQIANGIIFACALLMLWTLGCYIPVFRKMWKEKAV